MADTIRLRAGNKDGMPKLADRELAYVRDENALYVGTPTGNKDITAGKLTASQVAAQAEVSTSAGTKDLAAALNSLIVAMKNSGVMSTE